MSDLSPDHVRLLLEHYQNGLISRKGLMAALGINEDEFYWSMSSMPDLPDEGYSSRFELLEIE
jgi:hypothetical protein